MTYGLVRMGGRLIFHFIPCLNYRVKGIVSYQRNSRNQNEEKPHPSADRKLVWLKEYLNSSQLDDIFVPQTGHLTSLHFSIFVHSKKTLLDLHHRAVCKAHDTTHIKIKTVPMRMLSPLLQSLATCRYPGDTLTKGLMAQRGKCRELHNLWDILPLV